MIYNRLRIPASLTIAVALIAILLGAACARAAAPPIKLVLTTHIGREVDLTQVTAKGGAGLEDICTVESHDECQPGKPSSISGGFEFPKSVAGAPGGDVYVADKGNHRVQRLKSNGQFVAMFGVEVNATTKGDVCTAASGNVCQAGVAGTAAGQLEDPESIAVDPVTGDIYVAELVFGTGTFGQRLQEFTAEGQFVLEIGKEVNETTKGNLCTHVEEEAAVKCKGPAQREIGSPNESGGESGSFNFESDRGDLLAVGGPEDLLYVGDEGRIQEFASNGASKGEIPLEAGGRVRALTVDGTGDLYLVYRAADVIQELNPKGESVQEFEVSTGEAELTIRVQGLALDAGGHLAVAGEQETNTGKMPFGSLYDASTARLLTTFQISSPNIAGLGFNGNGELYAAAVGGQEILAYKPEVVAELTTGPAECVLGVDRETDATFDCTLHGEVNPDGIPETIAWFEWGRTKGLGEQTPKQPVQAAEPVQAAIVVRPNAPFFYKLAAEDLNVKNPEELEGERLSLTTPLVAPRVIGEPKASFITASSAVMFGELNPENANTEYFFEYAAGEETLVKCTGVRKVSCPGVATSGTGGSSVYGGIGATLEATGLQPSTVYHYRLVASSENGAKTEKMERHGEGMQEGTFTTAPAPVPHAETGPYSAVTPTSAIVSGIVDPDGLPAGYAFELGVYNGPETQYGVVLSGPAGSVSIEERLALTGLQPGTTYAYRISVSSGYIKSESRTILGAPATFTTGGLPVVLPFSPALAQLPVPKIDFPKAPTAPKKKAKPKKIKKAKAKKGKKAHKGSRQKRRT